MSNRNLCDKKIRLHAIVACLCEQGRENLIISFIFQIVEPLTMPRFDPFRCLFRCVTKIGVIETSEGRFSYFSDKMTKIAELNYIKTRLSRSKFTYHFKEVLIYGCENKGCELSAKFSFMQYKLSLQRKSHRQFNCHGYCMKEFLSSCAP